MKLENKLTSEQPQGPLPSGEDEIDIIAFLKTLWIGRKTIILMVTVFTSIGILVAMTSPNVYTSSTTMVSQVQSRGGSIGGLGGLAALAGINLNDIGSGSQDLSPLLYPDIVKSYPFQKEIIYFPLKWNSYVEPMSLYEYSAKNPKPNTMSLIRKYTIGLPDIVRSLFTTRKDKGEVEKVYDSLFPITGSERDLCDALTNTITLTINVKSGYLTLTAMGPEPFIAAQLADKAQKLLQARITQYRINKAQQNFAFIQQLYNEKKRDFEAARDRLARFRDRNLNMASNMAKTEEERLQGEYQLASTVYFELAKQLESSKIKVREDTPVFSIIQPVSVPIIKTKPNKRVIIIIWFIMGGGMAVGWIFGRQFLNDLRKKWANHGKGAVTLI